MAFITANIPVAAAAEITNPAVIITMVVAKITNTTVTTAPATRHPGGGPHSAAVSFFHFQVTARLFLDTALPIIEITATTPTVTHRHTMRAGTTDGMAVPHIFTVPLLYTIHTTSTKRNR